MPAVKRGGRKASSQPSKAARGTPKRNRTARAAAPAVPPPAAALVALGVVALGVIVVLATGGRAAALAGAVDRTIDARLADVGFALRTVQVQGASREALPYVEAAVGLRPGEPLARLDLNAVKARVEQVGWVEEARVVRLLPDTLVVVVEERKPMAVWQRKKRPAVIDSEGRVIPEADPGRFAHLPLVVGEGADQAAGSIIPLVAARPRLAQRVEALVRVDTRRWDVRLKDGSLIQLPAIEEDAAMIQLDRLDQRQRVLELGLARIDLRDSETVFVRPKTLAVAGPPAAGGA